MTQSVAEKSFARVRSTFTRKNFYLDLLLMFLINAKYFL